MSHDLREVVTKPQARRADLRASRQTWPHVLERLGGMDVVVANAGIARPGTVQDIPVEEFERIVEVDLLGVWRTIRTTLPHVIERRGYVIPIASIYSALHGPLAAPYAVAKAGVEALANVLRVEIAHRGVDVGVAYFSYLDTDLVRDVFADPVAAEVRAPRPLAAGR